MFGLSGGMAGVRKQLDLFGAVVLAVVVGIAGGTIRDLLIGIPPATFRDWRYLAVAGAAGLVTSLAHPAINRLQRPIEALDAAGLALFCVTGAATALAHRLGPAEAIILGAITGIGGGMVRDVLVLEIPTSCVAGSTQSQPWSEQRSSSAPIRPGTALIFPIVGAAACFLMRMAGLHYGLGLPRADNIAVTNIPRLPGTPRDKRRTLDAPAPFSVPVACGWPGVRVYRVSTSVLVCGAIFAGVSDEPGGPGEILVRDGLISEMGHSGRWPGSSTARAESLASARRTSRRSRAPVAIGFAIPAATAVSIADQLLKTGHVEHAFIGLQPAQLTHSSRRSSGFARRPGILVYGVSPGGPADQSHIAPGDITRRHRRTAREHVEDLFTALRQKRPGETVTLERIRDGSRERVDVRLSAKPQ